MSSLSPRLQLRVAQKQILTPGLVQMVTVLQLNRLELKDMILSEIAQNPVLEEGADGIEELTPEELQNVLERERVQEPSDQSVREVMDNPNEPVNLDTAADLAEFAGVDGTMSAAPVADTETAEPPVKAESDPFDEIDFGSYFDEYLDPGYKSPASENVEKPSFETFLSSPSRWRTIWASS